MDHLQATLTSTPLPYLAGILPVATIMAAVTYPLTLVLWDWTTARIHAAKERRAAKHARPYTISSSSSQYDFHLAWAECTRLLNSGLECNGAHTQSVASQPHV